MGPTNCCLTCAATVSTAVSSPCSPLLPPITAEPNSREPRPPRLLSVTDLLSLTNPCRQQLTQSEITTITVSVLDALLSVSLVLPALMLLSWRCYHSPSPDHDLILAASPSPSRPPHSTPPHFCLNAVTTSSRSTPCEPSRESSALSPSRRRHQQHHQSGH
ncbi:hypothetical protein M0R45_026270 [Rubus argutus]|uniref:Uncharacterized protein n=1 Tax=Rubus argutus TaxID=59490 RepID=A0AAW1WYE1_RUBAR